MIKRLTLIGTGLIGGSLSLALKNAHAVDHVVGFARTEKNLQKGIEIGVLDSYATQLDQAVKESDMVVLAVPLGAMESMLKQIAPYLNEQCIVTDVSSAKSSVVAQAKKHLGNKFPQFVAAHPIAGTEKSGIESGFAELFQNRKVILTPDAQTSKTAIDSVQAMWQSCGAQVESMTVAHHDEVFAATSHLPHMLAYSLVNCLANMEDRVEIFKYAAGGFRDISRIASSDPTMWRDVCLYNQQALSKMLSDYASELATLSSKVAVGDANALYEYFDRAKKRRDELIGKC